MFETIKEVIMQYAEVDPDEITESSRLRSDIGLSSFDIVNIAVELEGEFGVSIPDEVIPTLKSVEDYMDYISAKK